MIIIAALSASMEDLLSILSIIASEFLFIGAKLDRFLKSLESLLALISGFSSSNTLNFIAMKRYASVIIPTPQKIFSPMDSIKYL